jgi:hypothetical protein
MLNPIGKIFWITIILGSAFIIAACGPGDSDRDIQPISSIELQAVPTPTEPVEPISPVSPVKEPAMQTGSDVQPLPGSEEALAAAVADLSERTGFPPDDIRLVSIEAVKWSDASLGCPQEGFMYAQVITPGYLMVLEAKGQQYEYHTDQAANVILCEK